MRALGEAQVLDLFQTEFPDALELIGREALLHDWRANPASPLVTIKVPGATLNFNFNIFH